MCHSHFIIASWTIAYAFIAQTTHIYSFLNLISCYSNCQCNTVKSSCNCSFIFLWMGFYGSLTFLFTHFIYLTYICVCVFMHVCVRERDPMHIRKLENSFQENVFSSPWCRSWRLQDVKFVDHHLCPLRHFISSTSIFLLILKCDLFINWYTRPKRRQNISLILHDVLEVNSITIIFILCVCIAWLSEFVPCMCVCPRRWE